MPEGHTVHRTANRFNATFKNSELRVDSPQGRFASGAALLNGQRMRRASAVGKQLFIEFENGLQLRIHLGIYGKWAWHSGDALPEVKGEVRARFWTASGGAIELAELRGPTVCEVLEPAEAQAVRSRLGSDPLNPDTTGFEFQRFAAKVAKTTKSIGLLLMDQSVISGIGNVYRAEILFRAGLNPHTPGKVLTQEQIQALWDDSVALLKIGVRTGVMLTRDGFQKRDPGKAERHHVYKREGQPCRVCGTHIALEVLAGRKLYWCPSCQS